MAQNPCLYNASSSNWKGQETKEYTIAEHFNKINCTHGHLDKYISQHNYYMKLTREKSGQISKLLTSKQQWRTNKMHI